MPAEHWHKDVPDDEDAKLLTMEKLGLRKKKIDFDKMISKMERYKYKGHYCQPKGSHRKDNESLFFQDQEHELVSEDDYIGRFKTYKENCLRLWGWPATDDERNVIKKEIPVEENLHRIREVVHQRVKLLPRLNLNKRQTSIAKRTASSTTA